MGRVGSRSTLAGLILVALVALPVGAAAADPGPWVVRIHETDRFVLGRVADRIDLWAVHRDAGYAVALVDADERAMLEREGFEVTVDEALTAEVRAPRERLPGQASGIIGFPCYRTVEETYADLASLAATHPTLATWQSFGDSWEKLNGPAPGYPLMELVLTNVEAPGPKAPLVIIAAMHAREYATAELVTRFAEQLVQAHGTDGDATWILDHTEIHLVPQLNPDGRIRAETGLYWRKNADNAYCVGSNNRGVDLNRNSSFLWGLASGSSGSVCSETYRGPGEGSEPETFAIESLMAAVFDDQRGPELTDPAPATASGIFLSIHSYQPAVLYPWEAIPSAAPNESGLITLGRKFGFYTGYVVCQDCLPVASGTTVDEAYGEYGVAAYTFEIGTSFFQSCGAFESTILPDNLAALTYAAKAARRPYQDPAGPEVVSLVGQRVDSVTLALSAVAHDGRYGGNEPGDPEPEQPVLSASYTIDDPPWAGVRAPETPLLASDGAFDEVVEAVEGSVDLSALAAGTHVVFVTATDADGRRGVPTGILVESLGPLISRDGFESGDLSGWDELMQAAPGGRPASG